MSGLDRIGNEFLRIRALAADQRGDAIRRLRQQDPELAREVERMLAAATDRLPLEDAPAATTRAPADVAPQAAGNTIGPYRLEEKLGEGGFGVVYAAEQREPVRRRVALKVMKHGAVSRDTLARFEAERQTVAMMNHPGIARLFDAGRTDDGLPFFAMELVAGDNIVAYCDRRELPLEQRLELFVDVCTAVTHAHQRGVIHRDLKPGNILVVDDDRPQPKVIDFGIAKALAADQVTDVHTVQGQWIGTPAYMSPEQLTMPSSAIDVRSDVYALGAILYELLSGSQAIDTKALADAPFTAIPKLITDARPAAPSTVAAANRRPRATRIRGELDWIVLKAIERDRVRRYGSAAELGRDIRAFLDGLPVSAAPPSLAYQARKLAGRHRVAITIAAAIGLALTVAATATVAALISTSAALQRAENAEATALARESEARAATITLEETAYPAQLLSAREAIASGQRARALEALNRCAPRLRGPEWQRLSRLLHAPSVAYEGHEPAEAIRGIAFNRDGSLLAAASNDGSARVWRTLTRRPVATYTAHDGLVLSIDIAPDGSRAASVGGFSQDLHIWDTTSARTIAIGDGHQTWVTRVRFNPNPEADTVATISDDGTLRLWNATDAAPLRTVRFNQSGAFALAWQPDGTAVFVGDDDGTIHLFNAEGEPMLNRSITERSLGALDVSPDGRRVAVGDETGRLHILDTTTLEPLDSFNAQRASVMSVAWHPAGDRIVTAAANGLTRVHDARTGRTLSELLTDEGIVHEVRLGPIGSLAVAHNDGTPRIYDIDEVTGRTTLAEEQDIIGIIEHRDEHLVSLSRDGALTCWDIADGSTRWQADASGDRPIMLWQAGGAVGVPYRDGTTAWFDPDTGAHLGDSANALNSGAQWAAPAGNAIALFGWNGAAAIARPTTAEPIEQPDVTAALVTEQHTVVGTAAGDVILDPRTIHRLGEPITALAHHPAAQPRTLIAASSGGRIWAIDQHSGQATTFEHAVNGPIVALHIEADSQRLIAVTRDGVDAKAFDLTTGRAVEQLSAPGAPVRAVQTTPSGRRVLAGNGITVVEPPN